MGRNRVREPNIYRRNVARLACCLGSGGMKEGKSDQDRF